MKIGPESINGPFLSCVMPESLVPGKYHLHITLPEGIRMSHFLDGRASIELLIREQKGIIIQLNTSHTRVLIGNNEVCYKSIGFDLPPELLR